MAQHLARLRPGVRRGRISTWDRTGGNDDSLLVGAGETVLLAEDTGPGQVTHLWFTAATPDLWWGRSLVLRAYWDGEPTPSVEAPLGDLLGSGNCLTSTYASALFSAAPRDGLSLHSWFPMPYSDGFRITLTNDSTLPVLALYAYVDYERWPAPDPRLGRFHAWWHRERRVRAPQPAGTYAHGTNLTGADNYLIVDTSGRGHYLGASLSIYSADGGWYGEGDDMVFVDGDVWPPTVHGTGTEDYFGTAWSPATPFSHPYYGQPVAEREDWAGFSNLYRLHVADPIPFEQSLRATLEHGHANDRADDWSSVAYWYQLERSSPLPPLPALPDREPPWPAAWTRRVEQVRDVYGRALADPDLDPLRAGRYRAGLRYITAAAHRRAWEDIDRALEWLGEAPSRPGPAAAAAAPGPLAPLLTATEEQLQAWVSGREPDELLAVVAADWAARFDAEEARGADLGIGLRLLDPAAPSGQLLRIRAGACEPSRVSIAAPESAERLTLLADPLTLVRWSLGRLDPWEALLRGSLVLRGDGDFAVRLAALFPGYPQPMSGRDSEETP